MDVETESVLSDLPQDRTLISLDLRAKKLGNEGAIMIGNALKVGIDL